MTFVLIHGGNVREHTNPSMQHVMDTSFTNGTEFFVQRRWTICNDERGHTTSHTMANQDKCSELSWLRIPSLNQGESIPHLYNNNSPKRHAERNIQDEDIQRSLHKTEQHHDHLPKVAQCRTVTLDYQWMHQAPQVPVNGNAHVHQTRILGWQEYHILSTAQCQNPQ